MKRLRDQPDERDKSRLLKYRTGAPKRQVKGYDGIVNFPDTVWKIDNVLRFPY
jgi:hypothetical protein